MDFLTNIFIYLLLPQFTSSVSLSCPITTCTNTSTITVRFPFRINHQQPENCSYHGFNLYCTNQGLTALDLPRAGQFLVRDISYENQTIGLYDPKKCLPQRLLDGFNSSASPFKADSYVNYTLLSCPKNFNDKKFTPIDCLSNSTTSVMATSNSVLAHKIMLNKSCQMIRTLRVPNAQTDYDEGSNSTLNGDIWLSWNVPDCKDCEASGGICGFQNNETREIGCLYDDAPTSDTSRQKSDTKAFEIYKFFAIFSTAATFISALAACIHLRNLAINWVRRRRRQQTEKEPTGLDQETIDSYLKVVMGDSGRVPGLNDGSCAICLSDFESQEILRCIPDCQHSFHADCIDEWLKINGTCPVCRKSPADHLQVETT